MAILNQKRILNLIPKVSAPVTLHVSQGDVGTQIEFTLVKGDEVFSDTGNLTASVHGIREDGANFGPFTCTLSGSKVTFPLHSEMTAVKGSAIAEVVLVDDGGNKVGSANFGILVEESVFPLGVTYDNDVSVYESILAYVQSIPAQVTEDYNTKINAEIAARQTADSSLNEALASEKSARTSADIIINARIDNIIAPSGEAPSAAEVTDARVGADGVTYDSLGTANRTQFSNIIDFLKNRGYTYYKIENNQHAINLSDNYTGQIITTGVSEWGYIVIENIPKDTYFMVITKNNNGTRVLPWRWRSKDGTWLEKAPVSDVVCDTVISPEEGCSLYCNSLAIGFSPKIAFLGIKGANSIISENNNDDYDLCIVDGLNENPLLYIRDGHIITKNFNSKNLPSNGISNVKSFGAVGDGTTDDTVAIQNALNSAGTILIPNGTYIITEPLVFYSNTHLIMEPKAELKQTSVNARCVMRSYNISSDTAYNGVHDVVIEGGIFNANGVNTGGVVTSCSCIAMAHCKNITIKNVIFEHTSAGMHCVDMAGSKNVVFDNCIFGDVGTTSSWGCCLQIDGVNSSVSYPYTSISSGSDFYDDYGCENIAVMNCEFNLNSRGPAIGNHNYSVHKYIDIHDNVIHGPGKTVSTASRGTIVFDIYTDYTGENNHTDYLIIHDNIITDAMYGFCFDPNADTHVFVRDNLLIRVANKEVGSENFVTWTNNTELD